MYVLWSPYGKRGLRWGFRDVGCSFHGKIRSQDRGQAFNLKLMLVVDFGMDFQMARPLAWPTPICTWMGERQCSHKTPRCFKRMRFSWIPRGEETFQLQSENGKLHLTLDTALAQPLWNRVDVSPFASHPQV